MKKTNKLIGIILSIVMLTSITAGLDLTAYADATIYYKNNFEYVINNRKVTICGYNGTSTKIEIPEMLDGYYVTTLNFPGSKMTSISIPSSVTKIETLVFRDTKTLYTISVDEKNPSFSAEDGVLFNKAKTTLIRYSPAKSDKTYTIPSTVTAINEYAFNNSTNLTTITLPEKLKSIGKNAFMDCSGITKTYFLGTVDNWAQIDFFDNGTNTNPISFSKNLYINNKKLTNAVLTNAKKNKRRRI